MVWNAGDSSVGYTTKRFGTFNRPARCRRGAMVASVRREDARMRAPQIERMRGRLNGTAAQAPFDSIAAQGSLGQRVARAAELLGKILELRQAVVHAQHRFLVVDMHAGLELQVRQHRCEHVGEMERRMLGEQVTPATLTPLAVADPRLVVGADVLRSAGDADGARLPEAERIDGATGPVATGLAVAIAHGHRLAAHAEFDCTTKTGRFMFSHRQSLRRTLFAA